MTSTEKKARVEALKAQISEAHDMQQAGQIYSWEACGVTGTDRCTICGLSHKWGRNGQNTGSFDTYTHARGNDLTLAEAARTECE